VKAKTKNIIFYGVLSPMERKVTIMAQKLEVTKTLMKEKDYKFVVKILFFIHGRLIIGCISLGT